MLSVIFSYRIYNTRLMCDTIYFKFFIRAIFVIVRAWRLLLCVRRP